MILFEEKLENKEGLKLEIDNIIPTLRDFPIEFNAHELLRLKDELNILPKLKALEDK